jgi:hypothetical protein
MFEQLAEVALLDAMRDARRAERIAVARELLAVGHFALRRWAATGGSHDIWCVDDWDVIAAEVAAELGISRGRASSLIDYGRTLIDRLPRFAEVFLAGEVDLRVLRIADFRTGLITSSDAIAAIDEMLAHKAAAWNALSDARIAQLVDWMVLDVDPDAIRVAKQRDDDRYIDVQPGEYGMADIWGVVRATDAAGFTAKLDAVAATVCQDDPRTKRQRRADALSALVACESSMRCLCESDRCPAGLNSASSSVVIHLLAEAATVDGSSDKAGFLPGFGAVPAATVRELSKTAKCKPVVIPNSVAAEPQYRPSGALADFVRSRDLTCRWIGCDKPAWQADIDHTVPYPLGLTHASDNVCYCRFHHLLKTFHCGSGGWQVTQFSDGTMVFNTPSGRTHYTKPLGAQLFPQLAVPTGDLDLPEQPAPGVYRGLAMPRRKRARAQDRAYRIEHERNVNRARYAADPPPF